MFDSDLNPKDPTPVNRKW